MSIGDLIWPQITQITLIYFRRGIRWLRCFFHHEDTKKHEVLKPRINTDVHGFNQPGRNRQGLCSKHYLCARPLSLPPGNNVAHTLSIPG